MAADHDAEYVAREVIAAAVQRRSEQLGGALPWEELSNFELPDGTRQRLVDPGKGGIWNPKDFAATLSIITSPDGPYPDREIDGGFLQYSYQRGPDGGKNLKLRAAHELKYPVLRLDKVAIGWYSPIYPVFVVGDNPITREFTLTLDEVMRSVPIDKTLSPLEKAYAARLVQHRVHQPRFRAQVMLAYEQRCAVCSLHHPELLDAAHIIEDRDDNGLPVIPNGLSLCKIHHAAYDRRFLGITPDHIVEINEQLLVEVDGPMLRHGLQEMHGRSIEIPKARPLRPDPDRLAIRYDQFRAG